MLLRLSVHAHLEIKDLFLFALSPKKYFGHLGEKKVTNL